MTTYAVVDFEANGLPTPDVDREACLYFLKAYASRNIFANYKKKLNEIFLELDPAFVAQDWGSPEDTEKFESDFSLIWAQHKQKKDVDWTRAFVNKALELCANDFQWKFLAGTKKKKDYLCYADDTSKNQELREKCKPFDVTNEEHKITVLNAYFGPTVLSCALLHMQINGGKVEINRHNKEPCLYQESRSENDRCYYQVYKPDDHYIHSNEAQRIHNLSQEWLHKNGKKITDMINQFLWLTEEYTNVKFVAHNFTADQKYLLHAIENCISFYEYRREISNDDKNTAIIGRLEKLQTYVKTGTNWFCTLAEARLKYKDTTMYNLAALYKKITTKKMHNTHNAQMDVYACATIFCAIKGVTDTSALNELIDQIQSSEVACQKPKDFWRYAVKTRDGKAKQIEAKNFKDLKNWLICLKWDGFYVRLKRDGKKWLIYTRSGNELHPPTSFLQHVSLDLPDGMEMEGELVFDSDQRCKPEDRVDAEKRIEKRTLDFQRLHFSSLRSTKNFRVWHGLRLVLFAFPHLDSKFHVSYEVGNREIEKSQEKHTHITVCNYHTLESTQEAIEIFKCVVQMGCEGVIVRDPNAVYNTTNNEDKYKSDIFKLKQKIVTESEQQFTQVGEPKKNKDGKEKEEFEYVVPAYKKKAGDTARQIKFCDWRKGIPGPGGLIKMKLKYHEKATSKMGVWDLNENGMRHTCFATAADLSFEVEPQEKPAMESIVDSISVRTEPFQFIVETAYVFLDLFIHKNHIVKNKDTIDIGILKFTGKTDGAIQPQFFLHEQYARDKSGPTDQKFVAEMIQLLHHVPNDNQRLVFVVSDKHKLEDFREYTKNIISGRPYNSLPKDTVNRLYANDKSRKQQVDVILMEKWKEKKLHKAIIPWNSDYTAGRIQKENVNEKTICALVSPELNYELFKKMCETQFFNFFSLQNYYAGGRISLDEIIVLVRISNLHKLNLQDENLEDEMKHKAMYNTLLEYDQGKKTSTGRITREDFKTVFEEARRREQSCPADPQTNSFPYMRQDHGDWNVWHRAWRMSEAFFRYNKMSVSEKNPDEFKTDLLLWLPVPQPRQSQPADQESSEEELEFQRKSAEEKRQNALKPAAKTGRNYDHLKKTKRVLGGGDSSGDEQPSQPPPKRNPVPESAVQNTGQQPSSSSKDSTSGKEHTHRTQSLPASAHVQQSTPQQPEIQDDEQSPILSYQQSTRVVDEMETDDEKLPTKDDREYEQEQEDDDDDDEMAEPEEDKIDTSRVEKWLDPQVKADAKAEKAREKAEKRKKGPVSVEDYMNDSDNDVAGDLTEEEKRKWDHKFSDLYISALLNQMKIFATE